MAGGASAGITHDRAAAAAVVIVCAEAEDPSSINQEPARPESAATLL
jgi:hypothetical protein